jgi:hypothetical protein
MDSGFGAVVLELAQGIRSVVRGELTLARAEARASVRRLSREALCFGIALGAVAFAALALLACIVIRVGDLLEGRYALGALVTAGGFVVLAGVAVLAARISWRRSVARVETVPEGGSEAIDELVTFALPIVRAARKHPKAAAGVAAGLTSAWAAGLLLSRERPRAGRAAGRASGIRQGPVSSSKDGRTARFST